MTTAGEEPSFMRREAIYARRNYPPREKLLRVLWGVATVAFRVSPQRCHGFRRGLLRLFGARLGRGCRIANTAVIYFPWNFEMGDGGAIGEAAWVYSLGRVTLGRDVVVSHRAHLCAGTHDYRRADFPLLKTPITLEDEVWVAADAFVGPGVRVGRAAVIGAASVVVKDVEKLSIMGGNPALCLKKRTLLAPDEPPV